MPPSLDALVRTDHTLEAIQQLTELIETLHAEHLKDLNALSARFYQNKKIENGALELRNLTDIEKNKITYSFISQLDDIKEEIENKIGFYKPVAKKTGENEVLHDFLHTVLIKKYDDITRFAVGNTFHYFSAREKDSNMKIMIMVQRSAEINAIDKNDLTRIAQLKHRNLIQLLDANLKTFPNYIITEFVEGISLKDLLKNIGCLPLHSAKRLLLIIGEVMVLLKQKRFPYASIRPSKILIDQELEAEISPFDILMVDKDKRLLNSFTEDCYYFAPEILLNEDMKTSSNSIDKANQFCMAALGYEMITGKKLFQGKIISDILIERDKFFKDEHFRNQKFLNTSLPSKLTTVFKRMLQFNARDRYVDLMTAMKEIDKVRDKILGDVEIIFNSYKRCLHDSEDFVVTFQKNLILQKNVGTIKDQLEKEVKEFAKEDAEFDAENNHTKTNDGETDTQRLELDEATKVLYKKFYFDIHLVFDPKNAINFLNKVTAHDSPDTSPVAEYKAFLEAFVETVKTCDPRYESHRPVRKAWEKIKKDLQDQLDTFTPVAEMSTIYSSSAKSNKAVAATLAANSQTILTTTDTSASIMDSPDELENGKNLDIIYTNEEVQFDGEKA